MHITQRPIHDIKPYPKNAKEHPTKQVRQIAESIREFGFNQPIVVDKQGVIIVGHGRYMAALDLGMDMVPVLEVELDKDRAAAYRLADNKLNESPWNLDIVMEELKTLTDDLLQLTGFSQLDIDRYEWQQVEKRSLMDDFIIPPFSYWDTRQKYWQKRKERWTEFFGDSREGRDEELLGSGMNRLAKVQGSDDLTGTSEFDPVVAEICYKWFCTPNGDILDPFAGGVVRGAVAATLGYNYTGVDLSKKQIETNKELLKNIQVPVTTPEYINGDSQNIDQLVKDRQFDFVFSCPPYYDLEVYSNDANDLSNKGTYADFMKAYSVIIERAVARLKENRFACFVVGDIRDKDGYYRGFVRDTIQAFEKAGAKFYNDIVLVNSIATATLRARKPFDNNRKVTKVHQNVLVFRKGSQKEISNAYIKLPQVERMHHNIVVFYKGNIDEIRNNYKVINTGLDA